MGSIHKFMSLRYLCYSSMSRLIHSAMVEKRVLRIGINTEENNPSVVTKEYTFYFLNSLVLESWHVFSVSVTIYVFLSRS